MAKTAKKPAITAERRSAPLNAPEGFGAPWSERPREGSDRAAARADFDNKPEIRGDTAENAIFEAAARVFGTKSPKVSRAEICAAIKRSLEASGTGAKPFKWPKEGEDIGIEKSWRIFAQNLDQSFSEEEWLASHYSNKLIDAQEERSRAGASKPRPDRRHKLRPLAEARGQQYLDKDAEKTCESAAIRTAADLAEILNTLVRLADTAPQKALERASIELGCDLDLKQLRALKAPHQDTISRWLKSLQK